MAVQVHVDESSSTNQIEEAVRRLHSLGELFVGDFVKVSLEVGQHGIVGESCGEEVLRVYTIASADGI
jgi:hypothetical protein